MRFRTIIGIGCLCTTLLWAESPTDNPLPILTPNLTEISTPDIRVPTINPVENPPSENPQISLPVSSNVSSPDTESTAPIRTIYRRSGTLESFWSQPKALPLAQVTTNTEEKLTTSNFWKDFKWEDWEEKSKQDLVRITPYMSGFGEIKLYSLRVNGNRDQAVKDAVYTDLMRTIKEVDFQIESRFNLLLQARINEEAEVNYNIVQEPNMPQKTDVSLRIRKTYINFGDITKTYNVGSFTNLSKRVDGISVVGSEGPFSYNFGFGQSKSQLDSFTQNGSGGNIYPLRNKPVLEKSVRVWVNTVQQVENVDYQVNYYDGTIVFSHPKTNQDALAFSYEYTNPIEDFIPVASPVNFLGISGAYSKQTLPNIQPLYQEVTDQQVLTSQDNTLQLTHTPVVVGTEKVFMGRQLLTHNKDYYLHYNTGKIVFLRPIFDQCSVTYLIPQTNPRFEEFYGLGRQAVYYLKSLPVLEESDKVEVQGFSIRRNTDYKIDYSTGRLMFLYPVPQTSKISVRYQQSILGQTNKTPTSDSAYKVQFGYFREFAKAQKDLNTTLVNESFNTPSRNSDDSITLRAGGWPIVPDSYVVYYNSQALNPTSDYTLDLYTGMVTINSSIVPHGQATYNIAISYYYYNEYGPAQWFFSGSDPNFEHNIQFNGQPAHRILSRLDNPVKFDRYKTLIQVEYQRINSPIYSTLIYGKDYTLVYGSNGASNGQIYVVLYSQYMGTDRIVYGVPDNLTPYDLFRITYKYNKSNIPDPGDISHEQFALVYQQNLSKEVDLSLDVARTNKEYARSYQATSDVIQTNGQYGYTYSLSQPNVVENSEIIYINGLPKAIKNENYYINYTSGKITFINMNPTPSDNVTVKYSYYTSASGETLKKVTLAGNAIDMKTRYVNDISSTQLELMSIDDTFMPFGSSTYAPGSNIINLGTSVTPYNNVSVASSYFRNQSKMSNVSLQGTRLNQYQEKVAEEVKYSPMSVLQLYYKWEREDNTSDPDNTTSANLRAVNNLGYRNNIGVAAGPQDFLTNFAISEYSNENNYLNRVNVSDTAAKSWTVDNRLSLLDNRFLLKSLYMETNGYSTDPTTLNHKINENRYSKSQFQLGLKPMSFLDTNSLYSREQTQVISSFDIQNNPSSGNYSNVVLQNYQHSIALYPAIQTFIVDNPNYQFTMGRSERASLLLAQNPDVNDTLSHQLTWRFMNFSSIMVRQGHAAAYQSNNNITQDSTIAEYSIGGFSPFPNITALTLQPFSRKFTQSVNSNAIPNNTILFASNETYTTDTRYGLSWVPVPFVHYDYAYMLGTNFCNSTENHTTDIATSYQNYPREHSRHGLQFSVADFLQSQYLSDIDLQENSRLTYSLSTTNITSVNSISVFNNSTHKSAQSLSNTLFPGQVPIHLNIGQTYDDYIDTTLGLKYRIAQQLNSDTSFTWASFSLTPRFNYSKTTQYLRASADVGLNDVFNHYTSYLNNRTSEFLLNGVQQLNNQYSLLLNYGYKKIAEDTDTSPPSPNSTSFTVHSLGMGLKTLIWPDLSLSYTYTFKMNINDIIQVAFQNYSDSIVMQYTPVTVQTSKYKSSVNVTFQRDHSWGVGLNDFAQLQNNQVNNTTLVTQIQTIDNVMSKGVIAANVEIPMAERSNGNIEKFIFTAQGNYVQNQDLTGITGFNYSIISLVFSGKLIF